MNKTTLNSTSFDLTPYEWKEGDLITSEKLNALENLKTAYSEQASTIEAMSKQIAEIGDSGIKTVKLNTLSELYYYPTRFGGGSNAFCVPGRDNLLPSFEGDSYLCGIYYTYESGVIMYQETDFIKGENGNFSGILGSSSRLIGTVTSDTESGILKLTLSKLNGLGGFISRNAIVLAMKIHTEDDSPIFPSANETDVHFLKSSFEDKIYDATGTSYIDGNKDGSYILKAIIQYDDFPLLFTTPLTSFPSN